jgi:DNA replication and repair protein RecF
VLWRGFHNPPRAGADKPSHGKDRTLSVSQPFANSFAARAPAGSPRFAVRRLALTDYRCYANLRMEVDARSVVLTGPNGAGKTNLLEALSYLAPGRGLRGARLTEADRLGGGPWAVSAVLSTPDGERQIGTGPDPVARSALNSVARSAPNSESRSAPNSESRSAPNSESRSALDSESRSAFDPGSRGVKPVDDESRRRAEKRIVRYDGQPGKGPSSLSEVISVLWLTPAMDRLFVDGASARRRFLDRLVYGLDPAHAGRISAYERAMRERARLLRSNPPRGGGADGAWLSALEQIMAERAIAIAAARREVVMQLNDAAREGLGPFPTARIAVHGAPEDWLADAPALACEERLMTALAATRGTDGETGGAAVGPHRSDLAVHHAARRMPAHLCSTGEQKALVVGIVMANARLQTRQRGAAPLLLMDEVAAHFDEAHRRALFAEIGALGVQAWLTGTDAALFSPLGEQAQFFRVAAATVAPTGAAPRPT